ncbi:MAG TPA: indole-3-glycerol phosphate synthase TrpC [Bacteroidales bacterium]|nr:indole-3-glycerol phosphate synthase TrpC [Bacteroidales bacterium]
MDILKKIIAYKKKELAEAVKNNPEENLRESPLFNREVLPLSDSILDSSKTGIIAEFKRKSPSKGIINSESDIERVAAGYCRCGASGISVLTDHKFFGGSSPDLSLARKASKVPILRKDFIIDEYQIVEARSIGADAILLIAAVLDKSRTLQLARFARSIDLQVLLELHNIAEIDTINEFVNIVGVNNRDLGTFRVDTDISIAMAEKIPQQYVKISESGITSPDVIRRLKEAGYNGFLIGGAFMESEDPVTSFSEFTKKIV